MRTHSFVLLILFVIFPFLINVCNSPRTLKYIQKDREIDSLFTATNTKYTIDTIINLAGARIIIPDSSELHFLNGGRLCNCVIVGCNTKISGRQIDIFDDVVIEGTWLVENISTSMFVKADNNTLHNISVMCSENLYNYVTIDKECVVPIIHFSSLFNIPSNTKVVLMADIYALPTKYKGGYAMQINGQNIYINGNGHKITGTIECDKTNNQQWQHGIFITRNSSNVVIENVITTKFWGDGIYVMGDDIRLKQIESSYNGRQGLSLTHGHDIIIENSSFHHTGAIDICSCKGPGAGIDIEPNEGDEVNNIVVKDCSLYDNYKYMQGYINDFQVYNAPKAAITVNDCSIGGVYLGKMSDVTFENCNIYKSIFSIDKIVSDVTLRKSTLPDKSQIKLETAIIEQ